MVSEVKNLQLIPVSARDAPQVQVSKQLQGVEKGPAKVARLDLSNQKQERSDKTGTEVTDAGKLEEAVSELNSVAQYLRRELQLSVDEHSGEVVVRILDEQNDEVIRQIPSEEVLELRKSMENMKGVIFKGSA